MLHLQLHSSYDASPYLRSNKGERLASAPQDPSCIPRSMELLQICAAHDLVVAHLLTLMWGPQNEVCHHCASVGQNCTNCAVEDLPGLSRKRQDLSICPHLNLGCLVFLNF